MCQQHMKHWCNNVDWSLESVFLNINNRLWFKQNWDGDPFLLEYLNWDGDPFQILTRVRSTKFTYMGENVYKTG